jgi:hypothetical protein
MTGSDSPDNGPEKAALGVVVAVVTGAACSGRKLGWLSGCGIFLCSSIVCVCDRGRGG